MLRHVPSQGRSAAERRPRGGRGRSPRGPPRGSACARGAGRRGAASSSSQQEVDRDERAARSPTAAASRASAQLPAGVLWPASRGTAGRPCRRLTAPAGPGSDHAFRRARRPGRSGSRRGRGSRPARPPRAGPVASTSTIGSTAPRRRSRAGPRRRTRGRRGPVQSGSMIGSSIVADAARRRTAGGRQLGGGLGRMPSRAIATVDPPVRACDRIAASGVTGPPMIRRDRPPAGPGRHGPDRAARRADAERSRARSRSPGRSTTSRTRSSATRSCRRRSACG